MLVESIVDVSVLPTVVSEIDGALAIVDPSVAALVEKLEIVVGGAAVVVCSGADSP